MKKTFMFVLNVLRQVSLHDLSEDLRKIAVGLITAGTIGLFIPSKTVPIPALVAGIVVGFSFWVLGLILSNSDNAGEDNDDSK